MPTAFQKRGFCSIICKDLVSKTSNSFPDNILEKSAVNGAFCYLELKKIKTTSLWFKSKRLSPRSAVNFFFCSPGATFQKLFFTIAIEAVNRTIWRKCITNKLRWPSTTGISAPFLAKMPDLFLCASNLNCFFRIIYQHTHNYKYVSSRSTQLLQTNIYSQSISRLFCEWTSSFWRTHDNCEYSSGTSRNFQIAYVVIVLFEVSSTIKNN